MALNLHTFTLKEFSRARAMTLPPRPLSVANWPAEVVRELRRQAGNPAPVRLDAPNNVAINYYDGVAVLSNYNRTPVDIRVQGRARLSARFPHVPATQWHATASRCNPGRSLFWSGSAAE